MPATKQEVHATLGRISIAFASLEHEVREIITKIAFHGEWVTAAALIEDNSLHKNLVALSELARRQADRIQARIDRFVKSVGPLKQRRNLFIHGKWMLTREDLERGIVEVSDSRVRYQKTERGHSWQRGHTEEISFSQLRTIEVDVLSALKEAIEVCEQIPDDEEA